ncbi:hypothetical protein RB195_004281 [Necator americanus]|uniref:Metalloendopeptidase n=1 Tax=Necator americanus TaxID=51031 RepID=A0ABR1BLC1_NECAM
MQETLLHISIASVLLPLRLSFNCLEMRVLLLVLVSVISTSGYLSPSITSKLRSQGLDVDELLEIRKQLDEVKEEARAEIALTPEKQIELQEKFKARKKKISGCDFLLKIYITNNVLQDVSKIKLDDEKNTDETIEKANEESGISELLYQGDIVLTRVQAEEIVEEIKHDAGTQRSKRQAYRDRWYPITVWTNGVNYFFHQNATHGTRSIFLKAVELWRSQTCIDFHENPYAEDRIGVFKGVGCWSHVGRTGTEQSLSLGERCENLRNAAHEIGHSLGLFHTQSRHDRDSYITFNAHNVQDGWVSQFNKETTDTNYNYGIEYDYGSIMHYGAHSSSRNSLPTMIPRDTKYLETLGSAIISFNDLFMVNTHYNCTKKCNPDTSAKCQMNGYPHPRNCAKCICPGGYGGDLCDKRPDDGCGEVLMANTSYQYQDVEVGDRNAGFNKRVELTTCTYWIQAPKGSKVEVKIEKLNAGLINDGCHYGGVEIKSQEDQRLTGYRYCRQEDTNVILESTHNIVPVIFFNRYYVSEVKIRYRAVPGDDGTDDTSVPPESETTTTPTKPVTAIRPRPQTRPSRRCADTNRRIPLAFQQLVSIWVYDIRSVVVVVVYTTFPPLARNDSTTELA